MTHDPFEYDVALSFARQDRVAAEQLAGLLKSEGISVLLDEYVPARGEESDAIDHLVNLYSRKARYCVLFLSQHYPLQSWTQAERMDAQQRALRDANEYILPLQLDDTQIPGIVQTEGSLDLRRQPVEEVVDLLAQKLVQAKANARPLPQSHDLRSGSTSSARTDSPSGPPDTQ